MKTFLNITILCLTALLVHGEKKSPDDINIFCWLVISHGEYDIAEAMADSWSERCNAFRIMQVSQNESDVGNADVISNTNLQAYITAFNGKIDFGISFKDIDWTLVVHTDTFVLVDNLRQILSNYDANSSHVFGCPKEKETTSTAFFRCGFLASREAHKSVLKSLVQISQKKNDERIPHIVSLEEKLNSSDFQSLTDSNLLISPKDLKIVYNELPKHRELVCPVNSVFVYFVLVYDVQKLKLLVDDMRTETWINLKIEALNRKVMEKIEKKWKKPCKNFWSRSLSDKWTCIWKYVGFN